MDEEESDGPNVTKIITTISIRDSDSSLSLSLTPPSLDEGKRTGTEDVQSANNENSEESISEHLSSAATSVENDRSLQEIEIDNIPTFSLDVHDHIEQDNQVLSQEAKPTSLNTSFHSDSSIISLNALDTFGLLNIEQGEIKSILEEILNNEQFISDSDTLSKKSKEDSFDIFANLDLDDQSLTQRIMTQAVKGNGDNIFNNESNLNNIIKQVSEMEELLEVKDHTIDALNTELESLREMVSNPSTISMGTSTEYKQLHEDYHNKFVEYHNAIEQKDDLILQLTESLQQSIANREDLKVQVEHFKNELEHLQKQLEDTSKLLSSNESRTKTPELDIMKKIGSLEFGNFEEECSKLEEKLNLDQIELLKNVKNAINNHIEEKLNENKLENQEVLTNLKNGIESERDIHDKEITRLRDLLENMKCGSTEIMELRQEMEVKHQKEMEDLRRYFEQKCTDLEKNYSEEIFSQHSRKRSGSATSSDNEIASDITGLPNRPGPGGDAPSSLETYRVDYKKRALQNLSKTDLLKLHQDLQNILSLFEKFGVENASNENLERLKVELGDYDVKNLFKIEMEAFRGEMKNKYNAELEILNQDYENRVDLLMVQQEEKMNSMKEKYLEEIENLKEILSKTNKSIEYSTTTQEVANSGDFELNEVVQSYERRLQEQIAMAKIDIIGAVQNQIQRLAESKEPDEEWPQELLTIRDHFTEKYEKKIAEIEAEHEQELDRLKKEHIKNLNGALERARRRSLKDGESLTDVKVIEERDNFRKQASLLRNLLAELLKYFTQCEDEVNNTIVDELVRQTAEKNLTDIEKELNDSSSSIKTESSSSTVTPAIKRVHLAPNFKDLMCIIENFSDRDSESVEFSTDLKNELESCLEKLKAEANAVLALSMNVTKKPETDSDKIKETNGALSSLNRKLVEEVQQRMKLADEVEIQKNVIDSLEKERSVLEEQIIELIERLNVTQGDFEKSQMKISELLESGQREIVSEGYGGNGFTGEQAGGNAFTSFNQLQEKARTMLVGSHSHDPALLHLLEELVTVGERMMEKSKAEKRDLQQQIDVADKKYKQTYKFLEEQAADRELERDDSQKQILALQEQLKSLDRDRATYANINEEPGVSGNYCSTSKKTVEHLESKLRESTRNLEFRDQKLKEIESEKNEAVEKIYLLRDIIRDLESQVKLKAETEAELRTLISELEFIISQRNAGIAASLEKSENVVHSESETLAEHVRNLEAEVQRLRLSQELVGTEGALREVRNQLIEIESTIDKKTKDLEEQSSILSTTTCSSPSEDMSVRDVIRPKTPTSLAVNDCEIPLQQLARLKEKLIRHARAEDAALKRIRDLEMQVFNLRASTEEYHTERDILKKEISDQLVLISSLQIRLDDQRIRAEHIEKQTNSSLESKIYELQKDTTELEEHLQNRNKTIATLNGLVEEMKRKLEEKESEVCSSSEDEMIITMQKEIEHLRTQNELLHKRLNSGVDIIPNLVENIISDKNSDIESLRQRLESTEKQLEMYNSLNLDKSQISALKNLKNSGTSLSEVLTIVELSSPEPARRFADSAQDSLSESKFLRKKPTKPDDTVFLSTDDVREISSIQKIGPPNPHFTSVTPSGNKNSTEIRSTDKRVHFDLSSDEEEINRLNSELNSLKLQLIEKDEILKGCNEKLKTLDHLEMNIDFVQTKLEETQNTLKDVTDKFEQELTKREDNEKELKVDIVAKKIHLEEQERELQLLKDDSLRKDEMYLNLAKDMKNLKKEKNVLEDKIKEYQDIEDIMSVKNKIILELEQQIVALRNKDINDENQFEIRLKENEEECESLKLRLDFFSKENESKDRLMEKLQDDNDKLTGIVKTQSEKSEHLNKQIQNKEEQIRESEKELDRIRRQVKILENEKCELYEEIKSQKGFIMEKEAELNEMKEKVGDEVKTLRNVTVKELEKQVLELREENASKIVEVNNLRDKLKNLDDETAHLRDFIAEKDKIIAQFKRDSEYLQMNLTTIQNKMQESGNIIDLGKKLRDEQMKNVELMGEIQMMKAQMMSFGILGRGDAMVASIDEITGKVKKELDYSAQIDTNIINATSDIENAEELGETLSKLKLKHKELNKKFLEEQVNVRSLRNELQKKNFEIDAVQLEDAQLIEQLRIQLESATENETRLETIVESWKKQCEILEIQIAKLKTQLSNANSKTESTEYKNLPTREAQEVSRLKTEISDLNGQLEMCKNDARSSRKAKKELEMNLRYSKEMLELKKREIENLEKKNLENTNRERGLMEKLTVSNEQLSKKVKEVENSRILIDDMEQERKDMKIQIDNLNAKLRTSQEDKRKPTISPALNTSLPIADQLMNKIEEMNSAVKDDRRTMELILRLTNDNKILKNRILELETEGTINVPFESPMNRANYLFAKCLRVESYRKALIWQKKYLISLLGTYQVETDLGPMEKLQGGQKKLRFSGIRKFRCIAYTIIATLRMKFIVRRWHSGARLAENVNARYGNISSSFQTTNINPAVRPGNFQVGQPVSRQQFTQSVRIPGVLQAENFGNISGEMRNRDSRLRTESGNAETEVPWSGVSPPCREKSAYKPRLTSNVGLLKAPQLLNQYAERYSKMQEHLELLLNSESTNN